MIITIERTPQHETIRARRSTIEQIRSRIGKGAIAQYNPSIQARVQAAIDRAIAGEGDVITLKVPVGDARLLREVDG